MALSADAARLGATTDRTLNKLAFGVANKASDIATATTSDILLMFDASDDYAAKYADSANVFELMGITATAAELNAAADNSARLISIPDAATYTVLAANSGKPHVLPDLTADITIDLPTPASGLEFEFYYKGVAADAQDWIFDTGSNTNYFVGGLVHLDTDANAAGDEVVPIAGDGNSNSKLTVLTPDVGTRVKFISDGTLWIVSGYAVSATVPAFADQ